MARNLEVGFALLGVEIMGRKIEKISAQNVQGFGKNRYLYGIGNELNVRR